MKISRLAATLAVCLVPVAAAEAQIQIRREGPPPRPFDRAELTAASTEAPMLSTENVLVEARIDGKGPYRFELDTGAAGGGRIGRDLATKLGLKTVGQAISGDPSGKNRETVDIVEAGSLAIGDATFSGVRLAVRDLPAAPGRPAPDGILGFGLFQDYLLVLDYPARRVRIEKGELPPVDNREALDFTDRRGIPSVKLQVSDLEVLGFRFQSAADYDVVFEIGRHLLEILVVTGDNQGNTANRSHGPLDLLLGERSEFLKPRQSKDIDELSKEDLGGHEVEILLGDSRP